MDANRKIVAGHGRHEAAKYLDLTQIPVIFLDHLTETQARAYMLADNKLTDRSSWDDGLVATQLKELSELVLDFEIEATRRGGAPPTFAFTLADGTVREFTGGFSVFSWSQENSTRNGQLHSALAALEKWLCSLIDRGADVTPYLDNLLRTSRSLAVVGVLINVGKYKPELFKGPLKPLLGDDILYFWDRPRVEHAAMGVDMSSWARGGELIFQMGRDWVLAPYRKVRLEQVAANTPRS